MKNPEIVIATGYQSLFAYLIFPDGNAGLVKRIEFQSDSPTGNPLIHWDQPNTCFNRIAEMISEILTRYRAKSWGLACPYDQYEKILTALPPAQKAALIQIIDNTGHSINVSNVSKCFGASPAGMELAYEAV